MMRRLKRTLAACVFLMLAMAGTMPSQAADYTLRFAHFWPAVSATHKQAYQAWADKVMADSDGRIAVEVYPSATLAKPAAQYDAVTNRIADMTATVLGYNANRFPLSQVVELPGLVKNAVHGSCVLQGLYDEGLIADEFEETKPLFLFTHGPGLLHTAETSVKEPADLTGLRVRRPTTLVGSLLEQLGAQPVGMPAPESYQAMQRGVIDGVALPWEGALVFRLNELVDHHTEVGGLYALAFIVTMNKDAYDALPDDLKAVIDRNSGPVWSGRTGAVFDELDVKGRAAAEAAGHQIYTVAGGIENPAWKPYLDGISEAYIAELEERGLPGQAVYDRAVALAASCE